ncbi:MAG: inositol monophosphatase family protein [Gammaproteobacteria bacterium]
MSNHPYINIAIKAARNAGNVITKGLERLDIIDVLEKNPLDFVTEIDHQAEKIIIDTIHKAYPNHSILAEETGAIPKQDQDITWIIDPLDGTHNFMRGLPHFCVSIAVQKGKTVEHGVIYDPIRHELFTASRGQGARCNNHRLRVTQRNQLEGAMLATAFPWGKQQVIDHYLTRSRSLFTDYAYKIRCTGSAALDLAYVAAGRLDGFWELELQPWDMAAGALMIKEAGGLVSDFDGSEAYLERGNIVGASPRVFKALLQALYQK